MAFLADYQISQRGKLDLKISVFFLRSEMFGKVDDRGSDWSLRNSRTEWEPGGNRVEPGGNRRNLGNRGNRRHPPRRVFPRATPSRPKTVPARPDRP